jgi:hypothetical protein
MDVLLPPDQPSMSAAAPVVATQTTPPHARPRGQECGARTSRQARLQAGAWGASDAQQVTVTTACDALLITCMALLQGFQNTPLPRRPSRRHRLCDAKPVGTGLASQSLCGAVSMAGPRGMPGAWRRAKHARVRQTRSVRVSPPSRIGLGRCTGRQAAGVHWQVCSRHTPRARQAARARGEPHASQAPALPAWGWAPGRCLYAIRKGAAARQRPIGGARWAAVLNRASLTAPGGRHECTGVCGGVGVARSAGKAGPGSRTRRAGRMIGSVASTGGAVGHARALPSEWDKKIEQEPEPRGARASHRGGRQARPPVEARGAEVRAGGGPPEKNMRGLGDRRQKVPPMGRDGPAPLLCVIVGRAPTPPGRAAARQTSPSGARRRAARGPKGALAPERGPARRVCMRRRRAALS